MAKKRGDPIQEHDTVEEATPAWQRHDWTASEALFVQAYLRHGEAGRAYAEAFNPDVHDKNGSHDSRITMGLSRIEGNKLLQQDHVRSYVKEMREEIKARLTLTKDAVLEELTKIAMSNMVDFLVIGRDGQPAGYDLSGLSREQYAAIQEMTIDTYVEGKGDDALAVKSVKLKLAPKLGALEALGKHFKLFTDVVEVSDLTDAADIMRKRKEEQRLRRLKGREESGEAEEIDEDEQELRNQRVRDQAETDHLGQYGGDEAD